MEARLQRWGMIYMNMRSGHCSDDSVMKKPEKRNDANLPDDARAHTHTHK
jgi:hypothetical protein